MSKRTRTYEANEGRQALGMALVGVGLVGIVGFALYRAMRPTSSPAGIPIATRSGPSAPGGRPPGDAPAAAPLPAVLPTPNT